jgi:hypothetical protein
LVEEEAMAVGVCVFCVLGCGFSKGLCALWWEAFDFL